MFSRQCAVIYLYFSYKLIFHRWSLVKQFFTLLSGVLEYYHASLEPIMQYPYLRTDVFQGFREIGNAILFCLQLESFLVRNITFRLRVIPHFLKDYLSKRNTSAREKIASRKVRREAEGGFNLIPPFITFLAGAIFTWARVSRSLYCPRGK